MGKQKFLLSIIVVLTGAAWSEGKDDFTVDFTVGWRGCYRPMEWTPVEIGIAHATLDEPLGGLVTMTASQDELNRMTVGHEFVLTKDVPVRLGLVTKFSFGADKCLVRIIDNKGRLRWEFDYDMWDFSGQQSLLKPVGEKDLLIGLAGERVGGLMRLGEYSESLYRESSDLTNVMDQLKEAFTRDREESLGEVFVADKVTRQLPWDWTGYASLDLLVLYDPAWNELNEHQNKAIRQWVENGGHLLLVLGGRSAAMEAGFQAWLPVELAQAKETALGAEFLQAWGVSKEVTGTVVGRSLKAKAGRLVGPQASYGSEESLYAIGRVGFGKAAVLGFDPSVLKWGQAEKASRFWVGPMAQLLLTKNCAGKLRMIAAKREKEDAETDRNSMISNPKYYNYEMADTNAGMNAVFEYLYVVLKPLSIWWVIALLVLLALLLGPIDYLVLKRRDKLPWTWVTTAGWIAVFTAGAYYGVQAVRGGAMQLRAVSVIDGVAGTAGGWATTYAGLFAPRSDEYQLGGAEGKQWWSGIAPMESYLSAYQRGMGRNIAYLQHDGGNIPRGVPINIWSMQCLLNEETMAQLPIEAAVLVDGSEVEVTVTNLSDSPIRKGYVLLSGDRLVKFEQVEGRGTLTFRRPMIAGCSLSEVFTKGNSKRELYFASPTHPPFNGTLAFWAQGCHQRTRGIEGYLAEGAAAVVVMYDEEPAGFEVKNRRYDQSHIRLVRLVVFPEKGTLL